MTTPGNFEEINLFDGEPPHFLKEAPPEEIGEGDRLRHVSIPTIRRYPLDKAKANGMALLIFPGGGFGFLAMERHAAALANHLAPKGITVFGVKYRVGKGSKDIPRDSLLDAKRAMKMVRSRAKEWNIDPKRIGALGFSAGSYVVLNLSSKFDEGSSAAQDPVEQLSSRPDFSVAMCPWNFGKPESPFEFTKNTPPILICHAKDDKVAPIDMSFNVEKQLKGLNVPIKLEVYETGGHSAFNIADPNAPGHDYLDKVFPWLEKIEKF